MADYDLAIIGGGINGTGIARDAAGRGLRVLLLEQNDLASGTSSASTKLIHGGLRYLEPGESAVGTGVDVQHLAATPVGHEVTAQAEVTKVDGRQIEFKVSARDDKEEIGRGTHRRMAIDLGRFNQRLALKAKA